MRETKKNVFKMRVMRYERNTRRELNTGTRAWAGVFHTCMGGGSTGLAWCAGGGRAS